MPKKPKPSTLEPEAQLQLDFGEVIKTARVRSRDELIAFQDYDPVERTADYMQRAVQFEAAWDSTIKKAREELMGLDPRELYLGFIKDLSQKTAQNAARSARFAHLLELVAVRGFGMSREQISIEKPAKGGTRWRVSINEESIITHLESAIVGRKFLNPISLDNNIWQGKTPLIAASDVSQHISAVPVPARFFKHSVPFVLNNAAGSLFKGPKDYEPLFNPNPKEDLIRWMLIDPSYQEELEPEDYKRCIASAMDVGQYKFDLEFLLKADRRVPQVIFRDGSLFPQDAYLDNYVIDSRRGEFTREAIRELLNCFTYAQQTGVIYCGVSKSVQLKVYSAVVDWYIAKHVDPNWEIENYTLNDGRSMTLLLSSPDFTASKLQTALTTCLIRRSFTTRANLNTKTDPSDPAPYFLQFEKAHPEFDILPFKKLCNIAHLYMFFIGHSKSPQEQLPRYEFFHYDALGSVTEVAQKIFSALQHCSFMPDNDHNFMTDQPVTYLIPSVTQHAHDLSKNVGKYIETDTGQRIMAKYKGLIPHFKKG